MCDYPIVHGPACVVCGEECSGLGRCDDCGGAMCFLCANFEAGPTKPGYRICDNCLSKRKETTSG